MKDADKNSYTVEVQVEGKWHGNAVYLDTQDHAKERAIVKLLSWSGCSDTRVVESEEEANYTLVEGKLKAILWMVRCIECKAEIGNTSCEITATSMHVCEGCQ